MVVAKLVSTVSVLSVCTDRATSGLPGMPKSMILVPVLQHTYVPVISCGFNKNGVALRRAAVQGCRVCVLSAEPAGAATQVAYIQTVHRHGRNYSTDRTVQYVY